MRSFYHQLFLSLGGALVFAGCAGEGRLSKQPPYSDYMHRTLRVVQPSYLTKDWALAPTYIDVWADPSLRDNWAITRDRYLRDVPVGSKVILESIEAQDDVLGGYAETCTGQLWIPGEAKPIRFQHYWSRLLLSPWETEAQALRRITMTSGRPSKPLPTAPVSRRELEQAYEQLRAANQAYRQFMHDYARGLGKTWSTLSTAERKEALRIWRERQPSR